MKCPRPTTEISLPRIALNHGVSPCERTQGPKSLTLSWSVVAAYSRPSATFSSTRLQSVRGASMLPTVCWCRSTDTMPAVFTTRGRSARSVASAPAGTTTSMRATSYSSPRDTVAR